MTAMDYSTDSQEFYPNSPVTDCRRLVKNILSHKVFVGEYVARRYVEPLQEYRDVILCSEKETDLIRFIKEIQKLVATEYGNKKWLGITSNTETADLSGYCLWVRLEKLPFGKHWFQVRSLKIKENEIYLQLKYLRPFQAEEKKINVEEFMTLNLKEVQLICKICTFANLCEASKFSMILILTIATCIVKGSAFFLEFLVKITHELSILINSLTPVFIAMTNTIAKCIGGFYWLIFMLWRGNSVPPPRQVPIFENRLAIMDRDMVMSSPYSRRSTNAWNYDRRRSGKEW